MTKEAAIHNFMNSFGIPGYPFAAVPEDNILPYLAYNAPSSAFEGGDMNITVDVYYYSSSEAVVNEKAREISAALENGVKLPCDIGIFGLKALGQ